jgi:hypothetical protein
MDEPGIVPRFCQRRQCDYNAAQLFFHVSEYGEAYDGFERAVAKFLRKATSIRVALRQQVMMVDALYRQVRSS